MSTGQDLVRLRWLLGGFFLALAVPAALLVERAYGELKWESLHQYRVQAEELAGRIDRRLGAWIDAEEARSFGDYGFLSVAGDPNANFLQRSPLSAYPVGSPVAGVMGYFQVDDRGRFSSPLLPASAEDAARYGIPREELPLRRQVQGRLLETLSRNRLVQERDEERPEPLRDDHRKEVRSDPSPAESTSASESVSVEESRPAAPQPAAQAAFDALSSNVPAVDGGLLAGKADAAKSKDLPGAQAAASTALLRQGESAAARRLRKERGVVAEPVAVPPSADKKGESVRAPPPVRITTFESEVDSFEFSRLDSGHFVLFRKVWRDGRRYIQGLLIEPEPALQGWVAGEFDGTALARVSRLTVLFRGVPLVSYRGAAAERGGAGPVQQAADEQSLYRARLSAPLADIELAFSAGALPAGPGAVVVVALAVTLVLVLAGGCGSMYRLGRRQIQLARQQQDFVAAVSHELKTPLTSIRMYGEMLREGWVAEDKKATYYDFIHSESERLSRLIGNVLQLARMSRNGLRLELKPMGIGELLDGIRSKVHSAVERAGFELDVGATPAAAAVSVEVDADAFAQILINLVDNALKFSAAAARRRVEIRATLQRDQWVAVAVRDFGPGVPADQMRKIFQLFYRVEDELTRQTVGTGIGLALVQRLAAAMGGRVELHNRNPGAEFLLLLPMAAERQS